MNNKKYIVGAVLIGATGTYLGYDSFIQKDVSANNASKIIPAGKSDLVGINSETAKAKSSIKYFQYFEKYGEIYGIDPYLLMAITSTESNGNPNCKYGNNYGLMQINFTGSKRTIKAYNFKTKKYDTINITSSSQIIGSSSVDFNIKAGAMQLQEKARELYFNPTASIQGYNFGQNGIKRAIAYYLSNGNVSAGKKMSLKDPKLVDYIKSNDTQWITKKFNGKTALQIYTSNGGGGTASYVSNVLGYYRGENKQPWIMDLDGNKYVVNGKTTNEKPEITRGDIELYIGDNFDVKNKVKATDLEDGDLTRHLVVTKNTVNTSREGEYEVGYAVLDSDGNRTDTVFPTVVRAKSNSDNHPEIPEVNEYPEILVDDIVLNMGDSFNPLKNVSAIDSRDGNLTRHVIVTYNNVDTSKKGMYQVSYAVLDSSGNRTDKTINVEVRATSDTAPEILVNNKEQSIGEVINPLENVVAYDKEDGDLTQYLIVTNNTTNELVEGEYEISYAVLDTDGNRTDKTIINSVK